MYQVSARASMPLAHVPDACACPPVYTCGYMYRVRDGGVIPPARLVFHGEIMPEMAYYRDGKQEGEGVHPLLNSH